MIKLFKNPLLASLVIFLAAGCTTGVLERKYIGKKLSASMLKSIVEPSGHHFWKHEHLDIDYDYTIDNQRQTITFEGTIKYNRTPGESVYQSETVLLDIKRCEFRLLFADQTRTVIGVAVENIFPDKNIYETIPFKRTVPYKLDYKYMLFGYFLYSEGT